jgi:hypothetical protein
MTSSWGLASVLAMKFGGEIEKLPNGARLAVTNIPSMVLYGVWSHEQIALRAAGVPRSAAMDLSKLVEGVVSPYALRTRLLSEGRTLWTRALGEGRGADYFRVWQMLEGG